MSTTLFDPDSFDDEDGIAIEKACKIMAEFGYHPGAPSYGYGDLQVPEAELETSMESRSCAARFHENEEKG